MSTEQLQLRIQELDTNYQDELAQYNSQIAFWSNSRMFSEKDIDTRLLVLF